MREKGIRTSEDERIAVFGIAIFVCVFLGPFDTINDLGLWERVAFWTVAITAVGMVIELCMVAMLESKWVAKWPIALKLVIGAMIGAVPGTSFMVAINTLFRPEHLNANSFPTLWLKVTIMALLIAGLEHLVWTRFRSNSHAGQSIEVEPHDIAAPLAAISKPRLFARLPDKLREGQIISLSMQDHYVEINTTLGSEMLLMRLSDAIDLLDGLAGSQTHRSHWVASGHAVSLVKVGRRHDLALSDGRKIPVSNSYLDAVQKLLKEKEQA